jgi:ADP-heptose:LPS heptosyltransferase
VPLVVAMGAKVHLEAPPELVRLFAVSFPGVEAVHSTEGPVPDCDEICTVPSLALAFATELHTIPSKVPYLAPPPGAPALLPARTPGIPRIGLAWSGFAGHTNDANRSVPFERFRMIPDGMPFEFICLQKEIRRRDQAALSASGVPSFTDRIGDFADTAGLVGEVDLVIAVDTSIAHLAGAMGRPTWVLLPYVPDWRWMLGRADCPWYPTMRLFRQPRAGDWEAVFTEVLAALRDWAPR